MRKIILLCNVSIGFACKSKSVTGTNTDNKDSSSNERELDD
jgi:hypothetical protein